MITSKQEHFTLRLTSHIKLVVPLEVVCIIQMKILTMQEMIIG